MGKTASLTLILVLACTTLTTESCGIKLPSQVTDIIGKLATELPNLMNMATNAFDSKAADKVKNIQGMIEQAAGLVGSNPKAKNIGDLITGIGKSQLTPFVDMWKQKGKLDSATIGAAKVKANDAIKALKAAAGIK